MLSLQGFRTRIQAPEAADEEAFLNAMRDSVGLHHPWVSAPRNHAGWQRYLKRLERDNEAGFLIKRIHDNVICGVINLNIITYEALCSAYISYFAVAAQAEKGYMKEGMLQVIQHAFADLGLHRLEANIQPDNLASIALVQSTGFKYEGYSPRLLKINGKWCDHERWAILADEEPG
ncbi:MAG: GNAT family N-acetyltransferase [Xanthomonadales bacterium]|nr:GNAT family N-acetyltransferase [Xanthomonadales bacterium]